MSEAGPDAKAALRKIVDRLFQVRDLWEAAAEAYFEPSSFRLALQNCITTARTVTFIIQSNKSVISDFDDWYSPFQSRWSDDPIMRWARDTRNTIEKQGDLETNSQIRAEIIASYMEGPATEWLPQLLFFSPQQVWKSVPAKFRIPHIIENGTLLIERRWVANNLPDKEVLEALAHVYEELSSAIFSLFEKLGIKAPPLLSRTRPDPMGKLAMDRAMYLAMKDGSLRGFRIFQRPLEGPSDAQRQKLRRRYGATANWSRLKEAKSFREVAEAYFENARAVMRRDGLHYSFAFLLRDGLPLHLARIDHPDRASRYVLMRDLAKLARIVGADAVMVLAEAWTAYDKNIPVSGFAVDAKNRGEAIMLQAANSKGEHFCLTAAVERRRLYKRKVKSVGPTVIDHGFQFMFLPFFREWDCLDENALHEAFAHLDAMGIEEPTIR